MTVYHHPHHHLHIQMGVEGAEADNARWEDSSLSDLWHCTDKKSTTINLDICHILKEC